MVAAEALKSGFHVGLKRSVRVGSWHALRYLSMRFNNLSPAGVAGLQH